MGGVGQVGQPEAGCGFILGGLDLGQTWNGQGLGGFDFSWAMSTFYFLYVFLLTNFPFY